MMLGALRNASYVKKRAFAPELGRCPWCRVTAKHPRWEVCANVGGKLIDTEEMLTVCSSCHRVSMHAGFIARALQAMTTLLLSAFMLPMLGGALYFAYATVRGTLNGVRPDLPLVGLIVGGLIATGVGFWIPFRRFVEAFRSGLIRVDTQLTD